MRAAMLLAWLVALAVVAWAVLKRRPASPLPSKVVDELVKDPVCQTYVVRSRALAVSRGGVVRHFCSARCAERDGVGRG